MQNIDNQSDHRRNTSYSLPYHSLRNMLDIYGYNGTQAQNILRSIGFDDSSNIPARQRYSDFFEWYNKNIYNKLKPIMDDLFNELFPLQYSTYKARLDAIKSEDEISSIASSIESRLKTISNTLENFRKNPLLKDYDIPTLADLILEYETGAHLKKDEPQPVVDLTQDMEKVKEVDANTMEEKVFNDLNELKEDKGNTGLVVGAIALAAGAMFLM